MFTRAIILLVSLIVVRCSAKSLQEALQVTKSLASVSNAPGKSLRSAIQIPISSTRQLAVTSFAQVQMYCTSTISPYETYPVGTCFATDTTASATITSATQSGTTTTYAFSTYSTADCTGTASASSGTVSSTCSVQAGDPVTSGYFSTGFSVVSSIAEPSFSAVNTKYFSDSACASQIGNTVYPLNTCILLTTGYSMKITGSDSSGTITTYTTSDCSGTGTATSVTAITACALVTSGAWTGSYIKESFPASTTTSSSCFAGSESVQLEDGSMKLISEVSVGDVVLSADSGLNMKFSPVIAVPHKANDIETAFSNIKVVDERDILMTPEHLILAGSCGSSALGLMAAKKVAPGMCVVDADNKQIEVVSNEIKTSKGLYTIVTDEEYVIVNGFVASPFAYNHLIANSFYNVYRMAVKSMPLLFQSQLFLAGFHAFAGLVMSV